MSAPATKVRPAPIITAAFSESSAMSASMHSEMPFGTPGLNAFTGGLSIVMIAISPSRVSFTRSLISVLLHGRPAAVHDYSLSCNVARRGRCQENRDPFQLAPASDALHRYGA